MAADRARDTAAAPADFFATGPTIRLLCAEIAAATGGDRVRFGRSARQTSSPVALSNATT